MEPLPVVCGVELASHQRLQQQGDGLGLVVRAEEGHHERRAHDRQEQALQARGLLRAGLLDVALAQRLEGVGPFAAVLHQFHLPEAAAAHQPELFQLAQWGWRLRVRDLVRLELLRRHGLSRRDARRGPAQVLGQVGDDPVPRLAKGHLLLHRDQALVPGRLLRLVRRPLTRSHARRVGLDGAPAAAAAHVPGLSRRLPPRPLGPDLAELSVASGRAGVDTACAKMA
mmetsp:Transcript_22432/g.62989  ORF Transcript_22432/g.62989 Transcript_22432/m.62989 type:complete len:227 (-) Transcript_22432:18-698(-)